MDKRFIFVTLLVLLTTSEAFCDKIILKNGTTIEGMVIEKADTYIKVNFEGVELKFYRNEIKEIIPDEKGLNIDLDKYEGLAKSSLTDKVLDMSGVKKQLAQIEAHAVNGYAQHKDRLPPGLYEKGETIISKAYSPDKLYQSARQYFFDNFNRERLSATKDFYESSLAQKITDLEVRASSPEALNELREFGNNLSSNPPSAARMDLLKKLDEVSGATALQLDTTIMTFQDMAKAIDPILPVEKRLKEGELLRLAQTMREQLTPVLDSAVSVYFLYAYKTLSDEELKQYIDFLLSDDGRWFVRITNEAFKFAMVSAGKETAQGFAGVLKELREESKPQQERRLREISLPQGSVGGKHE